MKFNQNLTNLALRVLALGSKLILIIYFGRIADLSIYANYAYIQAFITISVFFAGMDIYNWQNRSLIKNHINFNQYVSTNFSIYVVLYVAALVLILNVFNLPFIVFGILIFEHLCQEFSRLLVTCNKQIQSSLILFCRVGLWPILLIVYIGISGTNISIEDVLNFWFSCSLIGFIAGICFLNQIFIFKKFIFDLKEINFVLKKSLFFLVSTICTKLIFFIDREYLLNFSTVSDLAKYSMYLAFSMAILSLSEALIVSYALPKMINSTSGVIRKLCNTYAKQMLVFFVVLFFPYSIIINSGWVINESYIDLYLSSMIYFSIAFFAVAIIPAQALYVTRREALLLKINGSVFLTFVSSIYFLHHILDPINSLVWSILMSSIVSFILKFSYQKRYV